MDILIIDNDKRHCQLLKHDLQTLGYSVYTAHQAAKALSQISQFKFKKIVIEQQLDLFDSFDLITSITQIDKDIKVIIMSRFANLADAVKAIKLGAFNYLPKPINAYTLLQSFETSPKQLQTTVSETLAPMSIKRFEWEYINTVLGNNQGNISSTARELGINRRTLQRKLKKYPALK